MIKPLHEVEISLGMPFKDDPYGPPPAPMTDVAAAVQGMIQYTYNYFGRDRCKIWRVSGVSGDPAQTRMQLVDNMMGTHLLMLDADSRPEPDVMVKLYEADKDIIGAPMVGKRYPNWINVFRKERGENYDRWEPNVDFKYEDWQKGKVLECAAIGFGCVMCRREVFDEIQPPYFSRETHPIFPVLVYGHDISFCIKAARAGLKLHCHMGAKVRHAGVSWLSVEAHVENYLADKGLRQVYSRIREEEVMLAG